jgi:hypothetical protein
MAKLDKRTKRFVKALGLDIDNVISILERTAYDAAVELVGVLQEYLEDVVASSESGAFGGYSVLMAGVKSEGFKAKFYKHEIDSARFSWGVWVEASDHHRDMDLNVFDILDVGRSELPKDGTLYPLWGENSSGRYQEKSRFSRGAGSFRPSSGRYSIVNPSDRPGAIRREPRYAGQRPIPAEEDNRSLRISQGPIAAVSPQNLYQRAFRTAKRRLTTEKEKVSLDLVYVPNREKWAGGG